MRTCPQLNHNLVEDTLANKKQIRANKEVPHQCQVHGQCVGNGFIVNDRMRMNMWV